MDWIDYREKLGIGFNDKERCAIFIENVFNFFGLASRESKTILDTKEYFHFCMMTGSSYSQYFTNADIFRLLREYSGNFTNFLAYCVAIINSKKKNSTGDFSRKQIIKFLEKLLEDAHIPFEIFYDENDDYFIFPKGAKEFDNALISEPLEWLSNYPRAHKTYCNALKQYSEGIYIRDVADNLRKALEEFLQEFLGNGKNLESNKDEICRYLGKQGVDSGISGLYQPLINSYKNINDRIAKHNDKIDEKLLEFLLYQTGILIRMVLTVTNAEKSDTDE